MCANLVDKPLLEYVHVYVLEYSEADQRIGSRTLGVSA
jgi:hypothetical protein